MRSIRFDPAELSGDDRAWWDAWTADAQRARADCVAAHQRTGRAAHRETVYQRLRNWAADKVFDRVCAYCEGEMGQDAAAADAEHFRPKNKVTTQRGDRWVTATTQDGDPHPGYYWLAYEWWNIIPVCEWCNRPHKGTRFPIAGSYVCGPDECASREELDEVEQPLLLHPYFDPVEDELRFDSNGLVVGLTERARVSIDCYGLARDTLVDHRRKAQTTAVNALGLALLNAVTRGVPVGEATLPGTGPRDPYPSAVRVVLDAGMRSADALLDALRPARCA